MKNVIVILFTIVFLFSCNLEQNQNNLNSEQANEVVESRSINNGFDLPICSNSSCPNKGKELTRFVRVIFKNRKFTHNANLNCMDCNRLHNHKQNVIVSLNLYQCTGCRKNQGGAKTEKQNCYSNLPWDVVQFPDKNLDKEVREELNKPNGNITKADLLKVKKLHISPFNERFSLDGIQLCENLQFLNVGFASQIKDLSPLFSLSKLRNLSITNSNLSDISALKNMVNLTTLSLGNNNIIDISSLRYLTKLDVLWLHNNKISNISPLKNLTNLYRLFLYNNQITDISPLSNLKHLSFIHLKDNKVEKIEAVKGMKYLRTLDIEDNRVKSIAPLMNLMYLSHLEVWHNNMDIRKGTTNRKVIDAIIYRNRNNSRSIIDWHNGNIIN